MRFFYIVRVYPGTIFRTMRDILYHIHSCCAVLKSEISLILKNLWCLLKSTLFEEEKFEQKKCPTCNIHCTNFQISEHCRTSSVFSVLSLSKSRLNNWNPFFIPNISIKLQPINFFYHNTDSFLCLVYHRLVGTTSSCDSSIKICRVKLSLSRV